MNSKCVDGHVNYMIKLRYLSVWFECDLLLWCARGRGGGGKCHHLWVLRSFLAHDLLSVEMSSITLLLVLV